MELYYYKVNEDLKNEYKIYIIYDIDNNILKIKTEYEKVIPLDTNLTELFNILYGFCDYSTSIYKLYEDENIKNLKDEKKNMILKIISSIIICRKRWYVKNWRGQKFPDELNIFWKYKIKDMDECIYKKYFNNNFKY